MSNARSNRDACQLSLSERSAKSGHNRPIVGRRNSLSIRAIRPAS